MKTKIALFAVVGIIMVSFLSFNAAHGKDVKLVVGEIGAMTGPASSTHLMCMSGTKDYIEYINEQGGVEGSKGKAMIDYITYDSQYQAAKAKDAFAKFRDRGMIVLTHCAAGHSDALVADHERSKIPLVTGSLGVASMWSDWVYANYHPGIANMVRTWAMWEKMKWEKAGKPGGQLIIGVIESDLPWAPLALWDIDKFAEEQQIKIVRDKMTKTTTDATPQLTRLKKGGARGIMVLGGAPVATVVLKSAKAMNFDIPLTQSGGATLGDVIDLAGPELSEGYQGSYFYEPVAKSPDIPDSEGMKLAKKIWEKNQTGKIRGMYINGLLSGMIIVEGIKLALNEVPPDKLDGEALKKYGLDQIRDFTGMGLTSPISYYAGDLDSHIGQRTVRYWVVQNGQVKPITDYFGTTTYRIPKKKK